MLKEYNERDRKKAMGLLSFHKTLKGYDSMLKEIDVYEQNDDFKLWLWSDDDTVNVNGLIGVLEAKDRIILYDISLNPSMRGDGLGYKMLDELVFKYDKHELIGTMATQGFLTKWKQYSK